MKRGAITKSGARLINVWMPLDVIPVLDKAVEELDLDRSKFIRLAIREKISRAPQKKTVVE